MAEQTVIEIVRNTVEKWVALRDDMRAKRNAATLSVDAAWLHRYEQVVLELHSFKETLAGSERERQGRGDSSK